MSLVPRAAAERLAAGVALVSVPGPDGPGLAVRTADGEFLRVDTGGVGEAALLAAVRGTAPAGPGPGPGPGPELARLTAAFAEAGFLAAGRPERGALRGRRVFLLGDRVLTDQLARCVRSERGAVRCVDPSRLATALAGDAAEPGRTAVVWCLDAPVPPGLWDEADRLPERSVAWLRCHREGDQVWLEPLAAAPGDVTSADVRLRRLAATPAHRELDAYWRGPSAEGPGAGHTAASAALTAGLLTAALIAWATSSPPSRLLHHLHLPTLTLTPHPILPIPPSLPLPPTPPPRNPSKNAPTPSARPAFNPPPDSAPEEGPEFSARPSFEDGPVTSCGPLSGVGPDSPPVFRSGVSPTSSAASPSVGGLEFSARPAFEDGPVTPCGPLPGDGLNPPPASPPGATPIPSPPGPNPHS
ncbi:hypothetical protein [Streptomyces sp. NPDC014894]|uniref:hypothetical protein n=1 Tax=Streptomyces sp. NPDC014894 TaxID=3364931 RepID=UPI0036FFA987